MSEEQDAKRYAWIRSLPCNSLHLERNSHACNYVSAAQWIEEHPKDFEDDDPLEIKRMMDTDTIWRLQIYLHTSIGFSFWNGATPDACIDAAMKDLGHE